MYPAPVASPTPETAPAPARRTVVLVADDVPENRQLFSLYLKGRYDVVTAATAEEALGLLDSTPIDVALLDINYGPGMDGFDCIRAIRGSAHAGLPAVALTAHVAPEDRDQCISAGFDGFLAKPVRRAEMQDAIETVMGQRPAWISRPRA